MKAKYYIIYFFLFKSIAGYSQKNFWTISGSVTAEGKTPIESAMIFVNNTSIGASTNEKGNFQLNIPDKFPQIELNVSYPGYKTLKRKIRYSPEIQVYKFQLDSITIISTKAEKAINRKEWGEKWKFFESAFLGESKFAKDCRIVNPEAIRLVYGDNKEVVATANEPVIIRNNALGYKIVYQLDKFVFDEHSRQLSGLKYFEKISPGNEEVKIKWDKNRKTVYTESFRNFLVALSLDKLEENDFVVYKTIEDKNNRSGQSKLADEIKKGHVLPVNANQICTYDKDSERFIIESERPLLIFTKKRLSRKTYFADYPFRFSQITLPKGYAAFTDNGSISRSEGIIITGYWNDAGLANTLPEDYEPENSSNESINVTTTKKIK
jgi:hypothetical protein